MIFGLGTDLVSLTRIEKIIETKPSFVKRVLTSEEYEVFKILGHKRQVEYLGGRFACKEAFSKAYGTGIGEISLQDISILNEPSGKPIIKQCVFSGQVHVSITHTDDLAMATVILEY